MGKNDRVTVDQDAPKTLVVGLGEVGGAIAAILGAIAAPALWFALRPAPKTDRPLIRLNVDLGPEAQLARDEGVEREDESLDEIDVARGALAEHRVERDRDAETERGDAARAG